MPDTLKAVCPPTLFAPLSEGLMDTDDQGWTRPVQLKWERLESGVVEVWLREPKP